MLRDYAEETARDQPSCVQIGFGDVQSLWIGIISYDSSKEDWHCGFEKHFKYQQKRPEFHDVETKN